MYAYIIGLKENSKVKKYIFTNLNNREVSFIKAEDLEEAIEKMVFKHINMGLGGLKHKVT